MAIRVSLSDMFATGEDAEIGQRVRGGVLGRFLYLVVFFSEKWNKRRRRQHGSATRGETCARGGDKGHAEFWARDSW